MPFPAQIQTPPKQTQQYSQPPARKAPFILTWHGQSQAPLGAQVGSALHRCFVYEPESFYFQPKLMLCICCRCGCSCRRCRCRCFTRDLCSGGCFPCATIQVSPSQRVLSSEFCLLPLWKASISIFCAQRLNEAFEAFVLCAENEEKPTRHNSGTVTTQT